MNYQDLSTNLLGVAALRILLLTFISRFVIDFLSIRKVIIFSAIATDGRYPLRSRSIHQNASNCTTIHFCYIAQPRGGRKTYCARSRNDVRRLTSRLNGMPSKKIMESLRTFVVVETVLRRGRICFKVATKFRILYFIMLNKKIGAPDLFTLDRGLSKFFAASSTTMESLPLKELDFGLQKRTGPSSGVVASIVLVSPGLECPGVSLVEVCGTCLRCHLHMVAWLLKCNISRLFL